jgi:hypothetical protein
MTITAQRDRLQIADLLEGQTAAQLVVAADDLGWWQQSLYRGETIVPRTGLQRSLARALQRIGWLEPTDTGYQLSSEGRDIAFNRGFVRVITRGWEPTFRMLATEATRSDALPAITDPAAVARGCTDIARRHPETIAAIGARIAADPNPGTTIDFGCADAGRLDAIAAFAPREQLVGVDIAADVIATASKRIAATCDSGRFRLRTGSVQPSPELPDWIDESLRHDVTTGMSFFLLHQLASDGGGIAPVLAGWMNWFPNLRRLVIGDVVQSEGDGWHDQPWFGPTFEIYHELTGVRMWRDEEYLDAFAILGWRVVERLDTDHPIVVTSILER